MKLETIFASIKKTKRLVLVEDGWENFGYSSEIITKVAEKGLNLKKPPVKFAGQTAMYLCRHL